MSDLFLDVFNASVAASWVVLTVIAARLLLKKAPRWMVCGLWALVAVRLLWPALPQSPVSLLPSREIIPPQSLYDPIPMIQSGVPFIDHALNPVYTESLRPMPGASVNPLQVWLAVLGNLWILGMAVMALWALWSCLKIRRQIRERIRLEGNVYMCDRVDSPFLFGLFRPIICLPATLDEAAQVHVIAHEKAHLARRDHWWKPLGFLLLTINWFNPLMWLGYILLCRDIEMACDERVARKLDVTEKKAYSSALLACSVRNRHVSVCPLAFGEVGVKQRIKSVLHYKKPAFWVILVAAVLIAVLSAGLLTNPVTPEKDDALHHQSIENMDVVFCCGFPLSWECEELEESENYCGLRLRPKGRQDWMYVRYYLGDEPLYSVPLDFQSQYTTLARGQAGWLYHDGNPQRWHLIHLETSRGWLLVEFEKDTTDWLNAEYDIALGILATLSVTRDGKEVLTASNLLGITLSVQNADSSRLTLVCIQQGHEEEFQEIVTDCAWSVQRRDDGIWVNIMPPEVAWEEVMCVVNRNSTTTWSIDLERVLGQLEPGHYRISKTFWGHPHPDGSKSTIESIGQTYTAEFELNPLGISLSASNVTPNGLTLVCQQDGTLWTGITTGAPYTLEQWTPEGWVSLMPESTAWNTEAYPVNHNSTNSWKINWSLLLGELGPGRYRIGKHFIGERRPPATLDIPREQIEQTCWAEFILD